MFFAIEGEKNIEYEERSRYGSKLAFSDPMISCQVGEKTAKKLSMVIEMVYGFH